jgi:hypothetical protein
MHTVAAVWGENPGSMKSTWIIDAPRCVSHSAHAASHALHPMQRWGST